MFKIIIKFSHFKLWRSKEFKKNWSTSEEILPWTARPAPLMNQISSPGRQRLWAPRTRPIQVVSSFWTSSSHLTTHSSPLRSRSQRKFTIVTSTATAPSVLTSSRISGHLPSQSPKYSSQSARFSLMPTQMILLCPKSQTCTRRTGSSTITRPASGPKDMPRESDACLT